MNAEAALGRPLAEVDTPALVVDLGAFERNLERMRSLVAGSKAALRPHAKAGKSPEIARRQLAAGARGICCAKLAEAEVMAAGGIGDILITTPVVDAAKITRLIALRRDARIAVVADDERNLESLSTATSAAGVALDIVIEVDVGQGRCGVLPGPRAAELAERAARLPGLAFRGLQGYHGAIQGLKSCADRKAEVARALERLLDSVRHVRARGLEPAVLTGGGTGSAAIDLALGGLTELQPGSYIFMDASYRAIAWDDAGAPPPFESALFVLAGVVSRPTVDRAIVDVGWKSASCDSGPPVLRDLPGARFEFGGDEHGKLHLGDDARQLRHGDRVVLIPSHCDTTVNLHDRYVVVRGDTVVDIWPIAGRGRSQ